MLFELSIENFAIIEKARIHFSEGLNIISGETGSGKSLVSDAIMAVIGGRLTKEDVRSGTEKMIVEAQFLEKNKELPGFISENTANELIRENGIETELDGTIVLLREFHSSGKSVCRINGRIVTLSLLKEVGSRLIDLIGQHDHQKLMSAERHLELLDSLGDESYKKALDSIATAVMEFEELVKLEKQFLDSPEERVRRMDLLRFEIDEIDRANFRENEEEELKERKIFMMNAEKIINGVESAYTALYSDGSQAGTRDQLAFAIERLESIKNFDHGVAPYLVNLHDALAMIDDLKYDLNGHREGLNFDLDELNTIERRLDLWSTLKRKYGRSYEEIMKFRASAESQYTKLEDADRNLDEILKKKLRISEIYKAHGNHLHLKRVEIGEALKKGVEIELEKLNMKGAQFAVDIQSDENRISMEGFDHILFMLSANPGEPLKPLDRVASGGEISRVMLALKTAAKKALRTSTMLFDEIDAGIGGKTALAVGDKIHEVSMNNQVICITHLAQIASLPGKHIRVEKSLQNGRTVADIIELNRDEKIIELARMLNGDEKSSESLSAAETMLRNRVSGGIFRNEIKGH